MLYFLLIFTEIQSSYLPQSTEIRNTKLLQSSDTYCIEICTDLCINKPDVYICFDTCTQKECNNNSDQISSSSFHSILPICSFLILFCTLFVFKTPKLQPKILIKQLLTSLKGSNNTLQINQNILN